MKAAFLEELDQLERDAGGALAIASSAIPKLKQRRKKQEERDFAEQIGLAIVLPVDFAAKTKSPSKGPKKKNCNPSKSHFCQTPNGSGSCVSLSKKCRFKPDAAVAQASNYTGEESSKKGKGKAKAKAAKAQPAAAAPVNDFPDDLLDRLEEVRPLGGSTGAVLMRDPSTGKEYVVKSGNSPEHISEEFAADRAYEALGIPVPKGRLYENAENPTKVTEFIKGRSLDELSEEEYEVAIAKLQEGYAADVTLGNWDVIGVGGSNVLVADDGTVYRVDNGGSLRYRAQGAQKTEDQWNEVPTEIFSMKDEGVNAFSAAVFGDMTVTQSLAGVSTLTANKEQFLEALPPEIRDTVRQRIANLEAVKAIDDKLGDAYDNILKEAYLTTELSSITAGLQGSLPSPAQAASDMAELGLADMNKGFGSGSASDDDIFNYFLSQEEYEEEAAKAAAFVATLDSGPAPYPKNPPGKNIRPGQALAEDEVEKISRQLMSSSSSHYYRSSFENTLSDWQDRVNSPDWAPPPPPPSLPEVAAVTLYTGKSYDRTNRILRDDPLPPISGSLQAEKRSAVRASQLAASALAQLPPYEGTVYRGASFMPTNVLARYQPGETVQELGFTSTSRYKETAFEGNVMFQIRSKRGALVRDFSALPNEEEVLFAPNTRFRVTKRTTLGSTTHIEMEEID